MKDHHSPEPADSLHPVLQQWTVDRSLPPRFEMRVWQRIRAEETRPVPGYLLLARWLEQALARPAWAVAYVAILLGVGLSLGDWNAHRQTARAEHAARALYVQAVDPYQALRP